MSEGRVEFAREGLDAWNRRDHGWMRDNATADFEFVPAIAAAVEGGSIKGIEAVIGFFEDLDESWETFEIEIDEFRLVGDQVAGKGRVVAKGRGSGVELDQPLSTLVSFDGEKVARMQSFLGHDAAIKAAEQSVERGRGTA